MTDVVFTEDAIKERLNRNIARVFAISKMELDMRSYYLVKNSYYYVRRM